jgi:hypothetical protein
MQQGVFFGSPVKPHAVFDNTLSLQLIKESALNQLGQYTRSMYF